MIGRHATFVWLAARQVVIPVFVAYVIRYMTVIHLLQMEPLLFQARCRGNGGSITPPVIWGFPVMWVLTLSCPDFPHQHHPVPGDEPEIDRSGSGVLFMEKMSDHLVRPTCRRECGSAEHRSIQCRRNLRGRRACVALMGKDKPLISRFAVDASLDGFSSLGGGRASAPPVSGVLSVHRWFWPALPGLLISSPWSACVLLDLPGGGVDVTSC